ncbi:hypothetical protein PG984_001422 [Apiospora sp. TS-2023a]
MFSSQRASVSGSASVFCFGRSALLSNAPKKASGIHRGIRAGGCIRRSEHIRKSNLLGRELAVWITEDNVKESVLRGASGVLLFNQRLKSTRGLESTRHWYSTYVNIIHGKCDTWPIQRDPRKIDSVQPLCEEVEGLRVDGIQLEVVQRLERVYKLGFGCPASLEEQIQLDRLLVEYLAEKNELVVLWSNADAE